MYAFLFDATAARHLKDPFEPFPPPSPSSKAILDSQTSAINCTNRGSSGPYDVKQIKDDALWLSDEAKIAEAVALRLVVLEWQERARSRLLSGESQLQNGLTTDNGFGNSFGSSSFFAKSVQFKSSVFDPTKADDGFDSEDGRRSRLLELYLTERLHILRTSDLLARYYIEGLSFPSITLGDTLSGLGKSITENICRSDLSTISVDQCLFDFTGALKQRLNRLGSKSGWYAREGGRDDLEILWNQNQVHEMVHILQLFFSVLTRVYLSGRSATALFELMSETSFLNINLVSCPPI